MSAHDPPAAERTEVLAQGPFKAVDGQRKLLARSGIRADVVCPPGKNPNG